MKERCRYCQDIVLETSSSSTTEDTDSDLQLHGAVGGVCSRPKRKKDVLTPHVLMARDKMKMTEQKGVHTIADILHTI